jgi:diamine N-acetyltransferase
MDGEGVTVREAGAADVPVLAALGEEAFYTAYAGQLAHEPLAAFARRAFEPERLAQELAEQPGGYLLLEVDGEPAGLAQLLAREAQPAVTGAQPVELSKIYLLDKWIGRGLGTTLMQACVDEARRRGYQTLWLGVWEHNPRAIGFYEKWGFLAVGDIRFNFEGEEQRDVVMSRAV